VRKTSNRNYLRLGFYLLYKSTSKYIRIIRVPSCQKMNSSEKDISEAEMQKDEIPKKPPIASPYINMLLHLDKIPRLHNALASLFTWLLLAGYVILPGAFTSIRNSRVLSEEAGAAGKAVVKAAQTWPVLTVASICCVGGASGMCWLWYRWKSNYIWLSRKIIE